MALHSLFVFPYNLTLLAGVSVGIIYVFFYRKQPVEQQLKLKIGNAQQLGTRQRQEDAFTTLKSENGTLAVVADGMGGLTSGRKASQLAVETFREEFVQTYDLEPIKFLVNTTYLSNSAILDLAKGRKMGTTLVAVIAVGDLLYWVSVGDSRIFLYRNQELTNLNQQHVFANKLKQAYQAGEISRYEALNHPKRERLTSYLGQDDFHKINYGENPVELKPEDKLVLCSDGVENNLTERELEKMLARDLHPMQEAHLVLDRVMDKNIVNQDNATIIVLEKNS